MPRFFFHFRDRRYLPDVDGEQLADAHAAIEKAAFYARELAAEAVIEGDLDLDEFVEVTNEAGLSLCQVTLGEALRISDA